MLEFPPADHRAQLAPEPAERRSKLGWGIDEGVHGSVGITVT